jgi:hypothetical protein
LAKSIFKLKKRKGKVLIMWYCQKVEEETYDFIPFFSLSITPSHPLYSKLKNHEIGWGVRNVGVKRNGGAANDREGTAE